MAGFRTAIQSLADNVHLLIHPHSTCSAENENSRRIGHTPKSFSLEVSFEARTQIVMLAGNEGYLGAMELLYKAANIPLDYINREHVMQLDLKAGKQSARKKSVEYKVSEAKNTAKAARIERERLKSAAPIQLYKQRKRDPSKPMSKRALKLAKLAEVTEKVADPNAMAIEEPTTFKKPIAPKKRKKDVLTSSESEDGDQGESAESTSSEDFEHAYPRAIEQKYDESDDDADVDMSDEEDDDLVEKMLARGTSSRQITPSKR